MGLPTGVEGKEAGKGDESAEETEQKPVVVAPPPVVETVSAPSAASPPADQSSEVSTAQRGEMLLGFPGGRAGDVPKSALSCLHGAQAAGQSSLRGKAPGEGTRGRHQLSSFQSCPPPTWSRAGVLGAIPGPLVTKP